MCLLLRLNDRSEDSYIGRDEYFGFWEINFLNIC